MKIHNYKFHIYHPQAPSKIISQKSNGQPTSSEVSRPRFQQEKLEIPKDFQLKEKLNEQEIAYFESLFPNARKEIRAYLQQQQKAVPVKGKFIDMKG